MALSQSKSLRRRRPESRLPQRSRNRPLSFSARIFHSKMPVSDQARRDRYDDLNRERRHADDCRADPYFPPRRLHRSGYGSNGGPPRRAGSNPSRPSIRLSSALGSWTGRFTRASHFNTFSENHEQSLTLGGSVPGEGQCETPERFDSQVTAKALTVGGLCTRWWTEYCAEMLRVEAGGQRSVYLSRWQQVYVANHRFPTDISNSPHTPCSKLPLVRLLALS